MKNVLVLFGASSSEHEVSIITGLQVLENIDRELYKPLAIYVTKDNEFMYIPNFKSKRDFSSKNFKKAVLDREGLYVKNALGSLKKVCSIDSAYLAFHGGFGENGYIQGFLTTLGIPITSCNVEGSVIAQNKVLTKQVLNDVGIDNVENVKLSSYEVAKSPTESILAVEKNTGYPAIVKPAHLGSSIGISVVRNAIDLEKALLESSHIDSEILVEKYIESFLEYNCSVRTVNGEIVTSPIERPLSHDEILSFADKYSNGSKSKSTGGMTGLDRELPAKISQELKEHIESVAIDAYKACRCKGLVRVDFMYVESENKLYLTEINPIPGSMAFYIWEADGVTFKQQITESLQQAELDYEELLSHKIDYETDIVSKFINS